MNVESSSVLLKQKHLQQVRRLQTPISLACFLHLHLLHSDVHEHPVTIRIGSLKYGSSSSLTWINGTYLIRKVLVWGIQNCMSWWCFELYHSESINVRRHFHIQLKIWISWFLPEIITNEFRSNIVVWSMCHTCYVKYFKFCPGRLIFSWNSWF